MIDSTVILGIRINPRLAADLRRRAAAANCRHSDLARWAIHLAASGIIAPPPKRFFGTSEYVGEADHEA